MQFWFDVGQAERHRVTLSFNQFTGRLVITVDGAEVTRELRIFSVRLVERNEFVVGVHEQHVVVIEKERKLFFAGFRPQTYRVFIDGRLVHTFSG